MNQLIRILNFSTSLNVRACWRYRWGYQSLLSKQEPVEEEVVPEPANEENVDQVETPVVETSVSAAKQYYKQEKHGLMVALEQSYVGAEEQLSENESKVDTFLINLKKTRNL